jgi:signal transduction histidine kinase
MMVVDKQIRVLIVDDISETRENIRRLLQFDPEIDVVGVARTGKEAIQLSWELVPDVIIMDINMPDMDGITATEAIRSSQPKTQVIILSVQGDPNYLRRAMLVGARDFLTKPPLGDRLLASIHRVSTTPEELSQLQMEIRELELSTFDLVTRRDLYKEALVMGKLVDEIEILISGLAHDLRSPISIILSILSTIKTSDREISNYLRRLWRASLYCKWIADTFLGISLSERISPTKFKVNDAVNDLLNLLSDRIPSSVKIKNEIDHNIVATFDVNILNLALQNVLVNSMESIGWNGRIAVGLEKSQTQLLITVGDDGAPIQDKALDHLFRLGFTTKKSHPGIGLYVSRRLIRLQGGELIYAKTFGINSKIFGILMPYVEEFEELFSKTRLNGLLQHQQDLQKELIDLRSHPLTSEQERQKSEQFRQITSSFTKNLSGELSKIEQTVFEIMPKLSDSHVSLAESFKRIIDNCAYCRLLISNIYEIGEGELPSFRKVFLAETVQYVLNLVDRKMPQHLYHINWIVDPTLPEIEADDVQLKQVFMNLIKNAIDAMPKGGSLRIRLERAGEFAQIEVSDTGIGIKPENIPQLFRLGFTTKSKGYGIGLYSVKNIIDRHNGSVDVVSKMDKGTTFRIRLPLAQTRTEV